MKESDYIKNEKLEPYLKRQEVNAHIVMGFETTFGPWLFLQDKQITLGHHFFHSVCLNENTINTYYVKETLQIISHQVKNNRWGNFGIFTEQWIGPTVNNLIQLCVYDCPSCVKRSQLNTSDKLWCLKKSRIESVFEYLCQRVCRNYKLFGINKWWNYCPFFQSTIIKLLFSGWCSNCSFCRHHASCKNMGKQLIRQQFPWNKHVCFSLVSDPSFSLYKITS